MKKIIIIFSLFAIMLNAKAQSGIDCVNAIVFANTNSAISNNVMSGYEMWFSFVGDSANIDIILDGNIDTTNGHAHRMELYQGTCVGLSLVDTSLVSDSSIYIQANSIVNGQQYYIKTMKVVGTSCANCTRAGSNFNLRLSNRDLRGSWDCNITSCGLHVVNGDFEANIYTMDYTWPFNGWVGCWGPAYGSPQIGVGSISPAHSGTSYARMWNKDISSDNHIGEGIFTFLQGPLIPGKRYIINYWIRNDMEIGVPSTAPTPSIKVVLTKTGFSGFTADPLEDPLNSGTAISITATSQVINQNSNFNNPIWEEVTACFTADDNYDILYFFPQNSGDDVLKWVAIDDVQLSEVTADAGADQNVCLGQSVTLGTTSSCPLPPGVDYIIWDPIIGLSCTNCLNPIVTPTSTITYTLTVGILDASDIFCIKSEDEVTVTVIEQPTITVNPTNATICSGQDVTLSATITSLDQTGTFLWLPGGATTSTIVVSPSITTTYTCIYNLGGCTATGTANIIVNPTPVFNISGSTTSCSGPSPNYFANLITPQSGVTFSWSTTDGTTGIGANAIYTFPSTGGTITFTATSLEGCVYTNSLYVGSCCSPPAIPNFVNKNTTALAVLGTTTGTVTTLVNQTFALNGTFTVNQSLVLRGCDLRMGYLCKILIDPGKTLTITGNGVADKTHIYACNEMWDGIYVTNPTSLVIINNGSTVEDALNVIVSENKGDYKIFSLTAYGNVIFNKNYKNIVVKNDVTGSHPGLIRSTTIQCYDGVVGGNPANTLNKLRFPHATERSYMGMEIINVNNITIGVPSPIFLNTFDNMDFGINSSNSSLNVYNNNFININFGGVIPKGIECTPGTAICATGGKNIVRTINVGSISPSPFYKNTFSNDNKGVVVTQFMNVNIWKNNFNNIANTGIRVSKNYTNTLVINENVINNTRVGVDCFDNLSANVTVDNNDIDAGVLLVASGIIAQEIIAGTTVYNITRNTIKNVRYGANVTGLKNSTISRNNVYLKHTTVPTQECYGVRLTNSSLCNVVANWVLGTNSADTWVHGISLNSCSNDYVVCNESHNLGTGMFFGDYQIPNAFIAKNLMNNNFRGLVINNGIVGEQGMAGSPNDNRWTGSFTWHTYSLNTPGAPPPFWVRNTFGQYNPAIYLDFSSPPTQEIVLNPTTGNLNSLHCPLIVGGGGPPRTPIMLQIAGDSITPVIYDQSARWLSKRNLYQYLKVDPSLISTEPLIAQFKNDYTINNMGKLDDIETVLSDPAVTSSALISAQILNNTVALASDVEINSKWMNNLLIENALTGSDYSISQVNDLRVLAAKCPYNDGPAVYQARVILSQIEDVEYLNECEMATEASFHSMSAFTQSNEHQNSDFKLFPNPNDGTMNFIYSLNETSKGELIIYDITGKIIATYLLSSGTNNQIFINETQLSNGVYFYKVIIDDEIKISDKIVIIK